MKGLIYLPTELIKQIYSYLDFCSRYEFSEAIRIYSSFFIEQDDLYFENIYLAFDLIIKLVDIRGINLFTNIFEDMIKMIVIIENQKIIININTYNLNNEYLIELLILANNKPNNVIIRNFDEININDELLLDIMDLEDILDINEGDTFWRCSRIIKFKHLLMILEDIEEHTNLEHLFETDIFTKYFTY